MIQFLVLGWHHLCKVAGDVISTVQEDVHLQPGASSSDEEALAFQDNDEFFGHSAFFGHGELVFFGHGELVFFAYPETSVALDSNLHSTSSL